MILPTIYSYDLTFLELFGSPSNMIHSDPLLLYIFRQWRLEVEALSFKSREWVKNAILSI
jgi:hypothetical protein